MLWVSRVGKTVLRLSVSQPPRHREHKRACVLTEDGCDRADGTSRGRDSAEAMRVLSRIQLLLVFIAIIGIGRSTVGIKITYQIGLRIREDEFVAVAYVLS